MLNTFRDAPTAVVLDTEPSPSVEDSPAFTARGVGAAGAIGDGLGDGVGVGTGGTEGTGAGGLGTEGLGGNAVSSAAYAAAGAIGSPA